MRGIRYTAKSNAEPIKQITERGCYQSYKVPKGKFSDIPRFGQ